MRFKSEKKRRIPKKILIILSLILIFFAFFGIYKFFQIKNININFSNTPCNDYLSIKKNINVENKLIFLINEKEINEKIKNKFNCIDDSKTTKVFPANININLKSREPVLTLNSYKVSSPGGNLSLKDVNISSHSSELNIKSENLKFEGNFLIDNGGMVIATQSAKKMKFVSNFVGDKPKLFSEMDEFIKTSIELLENLKKAHFSLEKVLIVEDKFLIVYGKPDVIFSFKKDPKEQVTSLQLILQQAKMNSNSNNSNSKDTKEIIKVDLRYDKPVITFSR